MNQPKNPEPSLRDITQKVFSFLREQDAHTESQSLQRKARALVCHTFGLSDVQWACDLSCTSYNIQKLDWLWTRAIDEHTPLSRILGQKPFWKHTFDVSSHTLDPRWETEGLITRILHYAPHARHILDLGTGTGCILISLLKEYSCAQGVGIDLCPNALRVAQRNALALGVHHRCQWLQSCWFANVPQQSTFDVIVTNPPYIPENTPLPDVVTRWDPPVALFAGISGLDAYRHIFPRIPDFLAPKGLFIAEIGHDQGLAIQSLAAQSDLQNMRIQKDDAQRDRYIIVFN